MLKKNQVLLILLTLVLMLSVYFISSPFEDKKPNGDPNNNNNNGEVLGRMEELQAMRVVLNEERTAQVLSLDAIIADNNSTVDQKNQALEEKRYLNSLTEKELLLEVSIINKGYRDCFVHASSTGIEITVVSDTNSVSLANEIILLAMNGFDQGFDNVSVNFQTAQEVMGTVA